MNWSAFHWNGFQTGSGVRKTGSTPPNTMASTTYSGARKSSGQPDDARQGEQRPERLRDRSTGRRRRLAASARRP